jgi:predicted anti-sigma-YlaC factor YlaD
MKLTDHKKYLLEMCKKVDRDLTSPTCKKLREHLVKCPECAAYYDSLKKTITLYRNYDIEYKGSCCKEVLAHLDLERPIKITLPKKTRSKGLHRS